MNTLAGLQKGVSLFKAYLIDPEEEDQDAAANNQLSDHQTWTYQVATEILQLIVSPILLQKFRTTWTKNDVIIRMGKTAWISKDV